MNIIEASEKGKIDIVSQLIQQDKSVLLTTTDLGMTPLHRVARFGHIEIVRELLDAGVKPTITDARKWTPLHDAACEEESLFCLELLLRAGCPVDVKDVYGDTPLMVACTYSNLPSVAYLLKCGASVTTKNRRGLNALRCTEYQLNGIEQRKGSDWKGQTRALQSIIAFIVEGNSR